MKTDKRLQELLETIKKENKIHVITTKQDKQEARKIAKGNFPDALHVILAKKANAFYLTTQDRHFENFEEFMEKMVLNLFPLKIFNNFISNFLKFG